MTDVFVHYEKEFLEKLRNLTNILQESSSSDPFRSLPHINALVEQADQSFKALSVQFSSLKYQPPQLKAALNQYKANFKAVQRQIHNLSHHQQSHTNLTNQQPQQQPQYKQQISLLSKGNKELASIKKSMWENEEVCNGIGVALLEHSDRIDQLREKNEEVRGQLTIGRRLIEGMQERLQRHSLYIKAAVGLMLLTFIAIFFLA